MTSGEKARQYFTEGYNCSQAVLLAFSDRLGLDTENAAKLASSFGGGMGRMREVCGAVSALFMVAGLYRGYSSPAAREEKSEHYALIQKLADEFKKENGSIICRELLGLTDRKQSPVPEERNEEYYKKRPCAEIVACAADIAERMLFFDNSEKGVN